MADIDNYFPFMIKWEGGYCNDPDDAGGPTKYGVTLADAKAAGFDKNGDGKVTAEDVKLLTKEDAKSNLKKKYWDKCKADDIKNQSIANIIVDWCYNSGTGKIKNVQTIVGTKADGIVGHKTISAINSYNTQKDLFNKIWNARKTFYYNIVKNKPSQKKFLKGWMNRLNGLKFSE